MLPTDSKMTDASIALFWWASLTAGIFSQVRFFLKCASSQKGHLRQTETDGIIRRIVHHQVPPMVEYCLTDWGQSLCQALDALLKWATLCEEMSAPAEQTGEQMIYCD